MDKQKHILPSRLVLMTLIILSFHVVQSYAKDKMNGPFKQRSTIHFEKYGERTNIFLNFYQKWISPIKGQNRCPMYPSCSQYAKIAFQVLPWYKGYLKSLERLLRCGHELHLYPTVKINGNIRWYNPVYIKESNDVHKIPN